MATLRQLIPAGLSTTCCYALDVQRIVSRDSTMKRVEPQGRAVYCSIGTRWHSCSSLQDYSYKLCDVVGEHHQGGFERLNEE